MHALSDDDGDGIWSVTLTVLPGLTGNYLFLNGAGAGDIASSLHPSNPWCAGIERTLPPVAYRENTVIHYCYGDCSDNTDGSCPSTSDLTFHVNTANIQVDENGVH